MTPDETPDDTPADPLAALRRWEEAGGVWRPLTLSADSATVGLYTCDGGEEVSRFSSADEEFVAAVTARLGGGGEDA